LEVGGWELTSNIPTVRRGAFEVAIVLIAAAAAIAPLPPRLVEAAFSTRLYPWIQHVITPATNLLPIAVFDLLLVAAIAVVVVQLVRAVRRARRDRQVGPILVTLWHLLVGAALVYLVFLTVWGLNYRRLRMQDRLVLANAAPDRTAVMKLGQESVRRMNELHEAAHKAGWPGAEWKDERLRAAFRRVQLMLGDGPVAEPGRLKWTMLGPYFRWTSVDGMVDPFALEVLANPDLLPWERVFVAAHEWAHLAGYADESEANFVGWLTCLRADEAAQYSGWLYLYWQINGELAPQGRTELAKALGEGPRRDISAIVERLRRGQLPLLRNASLVVYDKYLRANRVEEGIRSYGEVVTLILRARFEDGWTPVRRDAR
jgi:hypothetical protein